MAQQTVSKMERVQTAVEWLVEQLLIYGDKALNKEISLGQYHIKKQELIEQAKQMEKEQRIKDYNVGYLDAKCNHINDAENYVNEQDYLNSDSTV